jgi:hypothetical protein
VRALDSASRGRSNRRHQLFLFLLKRGENVSQECVFLHEYRSALIANQEVFLHQSEIAIGGDPSQCIQFSFVRRKMV